MAFGDVWILGAGASAEVGAPTTAEFWRAAEDLRPRLEPDERAAFDAVLEDIGAVTDVRVVYTRIAGSRHLWIVDTSPEGQP